jgi:hypothetical protein
MTRQASNPRIGKPGGSISGASSDADTERVGVPGEFKSTEEIVDNVENIRKKAGLPSTFVDEKARFKGGWRSYQVGKISYFAGEYRLAQAEGMMAEFRQLAREQKLSKEEGDRRFQPIKEEIEAAHTQIGAEEFRARDYERKRELAERKAQAEAEAKQEGEDTTPSYWKDGWFIR